MAGRDAPTPLDGLQIRRPLPLEMVNVAAFLGAAMADNPNHIAVYGADRLMRSRRHAVLMRAFLGRRAAGPMLAAFDRGVPVGFIAATASPACQPDAAESVRMAGALVRLGPASGARVLVWQRAWGQHHPAVPHLHVGPLAVREDWRGRGLGRRLLKTSLVACAEAGFPSRAYLETDREQNVGFYSSAGFVVRSEGGVLGQPNWFMERPATDTGNR